VIFFAGFDGETGDSLVIAGFWIVEQCNAKHYNACHCYDNIKGEVAHFLLVIATTKITVAMRPIIKYTKNKGFMRGSLLIEY
jgi:hypothetical protein